jgi:hypothetical protein
LMRLWRNFGAHRQHVIRQQLPQCRKRQLKKRQQSGQMSTDSSSRSFLGSLAQTQQQYLTGSCMEERCLSLS